MQLEDLQKSVTALEIEYGAFKNCRTLYYFREIDGQVPEDYQSEDKEHAEKLSALKQLINKKSGGKIKTYKLKWNGKGFDGTEDFAKMLAEDIKAMLMNEWLENDKLSPLQREMRVHEKFISDKKDVFSACLREAEELKQRILEQPVTIMEGAVGSGKSTLFSKLATELQKREWKILPFISGLINRSNDAQDIIENIVEFLETESHMSEHYKDEKDRQTGENIRHTPEQWREKLAEMCARYTQEKHQKLLIMTDTVDQLSQNDQRDELHFIPFNVGENIHFAMTSTLDFDTRSAEFYTLKDIDEDDKKEVINGTLKRVHKQLSKKVVDKIVSLKTSENPLYISLLVQRLVLMDEDDFKIIYKFGDGMPAIEQHQIDIISGCPDDLDEMSAELLRVASKGIYVGREWLAEKCKKWAWDSNEPCRLFVIYGEAGSGKTAFVQHLSIDRELVRSVHVCVYDRPATRSAKNTLKDLSFVLAKNNDHYYERLKSKDFNIIDKLTEDGLFEFLFIEPLKDETEKYLIIIDGLDELDSLNGFEPLVKIFRQYASQINPNISFLVTGRPDENIREKLRTVSKNGLTHVFLDKNSNAGDLKMFIQNKLNEIGIYSDTLSAKILEACDGNFEYLSLLFKEVMEEGLELSENISLPKGLYNRYTQYLDRKLDEQGYK